MKRVRKWTPEEDAILVKRKAEGVFYRDIALELGRSEVAIRSRVLHMKDNYSHKPSSKKCIIEGCSGYQHAWGWCGMHYKHFLQTGSPVEGRFRAETCKYGHPYTEETTRYWGVKQVQKCCMVCYRIRSFEGVLRTRYNITIYDYASMLNNQNLCCALCKQPTEDFCIDHDHSCCDRAGSCGKCVRALLCTSCNVRVGAYEALLRKVSKEDVDSYITNKPI